MAPLPLSFLPRHVTAASVMRFDDEYPTLICNVAYGSSPDQDTREASRIDRAFGIKPESILINLGDLTISYSRPWRLDAIHLVMAPRRWRRSRLSTLPERAEPAFIRFDVETDEGGHFTSDVTLEVTWDREQNQLAVRHPLHSPGGIWRSLADHVYVLSDPSGVFQELRFTDVMIDFPDEPAV